LIRPYKAAIDGFDAVAVPLRQRLQPAIHADAFVVAGELDRQIFGLAGWIMENALVSGVTVPAFNADLAPHVFSGMSQDFTKGNGRLGRERGLPFHHALTGASAQQKQKK
jgi:hypothetical protein